jgi:hypothetical protein
MINITIAASKRELSEAQKEYRKFFKDRVAAHGKDHPFKGDADEVADFLLGISDEWAKHKAKNNIETKA